MIIKDGSIVTIQYKLKNEADEVISASEESNPLIFKQGTKAIIPGLEKELFGKKAGDTFSVTVEPVEAYGEVDPTLFAEIKREAFSGVDDIQPGMQFQTEDDNGNTQVITVIEANEEKVTVDRNHPLAGKTLFFDIEVVAVTID